MKKFRLKRESIGKISKVAIFIGVAMILFALISSDSIVAIGLFLNGAIFAIAGFTYSNPKKDVFIPKLHPFVFALAFNAITSLLVVKLFQFVGVSTLFAILFGLSLTTIATWGYYRYLFKP